MTQRGISMLNNKSLLTFLIKKNLILKGSLLRYILLILIGLCSFTTTSWSTTRILWDASHTPLGRYTPYGEYFQLKQMLEASDFIVVTQQDILTRQTLWEYDILVISILSNYENPYTASEIDNILEFSRIGGIIILGDNSAVRRRNLEGLLNAFGLRAAMDDQIGNLVNLINSPIFEGVDSVVFRYGSTVGSVPGGNNGRILATDRNNRAGIVQYQPWGRVLLIGDADLWTNSLIFEAGNAQLAMNCFNFVKFPPVESELIVQGTNHQIFLPQNRNYTLYYTLRNNGNNQLRFGCEVAGGGWISITPTGGVLQPNGENRITTNISTQNLGINSSVSAQLIFLHNALNRQFPSYNIVLNVVSPVPVHFNMPLPGISDHSLLIQELKLEGDICPPGAEVAVFTPARFCAGGAVYDGTRFGISAVADDPLTEAIDGFQSGEIFRFSVYLPWSNEEIPTQIYFIEGPQQFTRDGLTVLNLDARPSGELQLNLNSRWNWISLNVVPPVLDFDYIFGELIRDGSILLIKDGRGRFYDPRRGYNGIGNWNIRDGYAVMVAQPQTLTIQGAIADSETPILLQIGWNLIAYLPQQPQSLITAFREIIDHLYMVKQDNGAFYLRNWDWDGIGTLEPGEGYSLKMSASDTLIYPNPQDNVVTCPKKSPTFTPSPSGLDMSFLLFNLPPFTMVKLFDTNTNLVGEGYADINGTLAMPIWGDDETTEIKEGLKNGETFIAMMKNDKGWEKVEFKNLEGEPKYETDGLIVGKFIGLPKGYSLIDAFPNPFNHTLTIHKSDELTADFNISLYDVTGRLVMQKYVQADEKLISISTDRLPTGLIIIDWKCGDYKGRFKAVHLP